jgi:hypothetical protein
MTMIPQTRREFLADVGKGMVVASVGTALAADLGLGEAFAADTTEALRFGKREPLVCLMQETAADKLLPLLVDKLNKGTELQDLVAAAALANARTFGGEDYVGFHTMMALAPCNAMARELPQAQRALPVLKVLYRNSNRIKERAKEKGGRMDEVLHPVKPAALPRGKAAGEAIREATRKQDLKTAEGVFAAVAREGADEAFNAVQYAMQDGPEVHRVVMVSRAWDLVGLLGKEQAHTLLRQSVHYCVKNEPWSAKYNSAVRTLIPKLLDQHKLLGKSPGKRKVDDAWVDKMSRTLFKSKPEQAAEAVAAALAEGILPDALGEAISLAANQLVLRDAGRRKNEVQPNKPLGSVHGDSIGVHASDSANAWRNIARVSNARNTVVSLILGGYQVALDRVARGGDFLNWKPYPVAEARAKIKTREAKALLQEAEDAIRNKDQVKVCAVVHRYGELGHAPRAVFDLLLRYAVSQDGALHAEKYYRTVSEEYARSRPAFRWRHVLGLARVTASAYGYAAPGYADAYKLLKITKA